MVFLIIYFQKILIVMFVKIKNNMGRKRINDKIKELKGTDQPCRMSGIESNGEFEFKKPCWLDYQGGKAWSTMYDFLKSQNMIIERDEIALEMLADVYSEWRNARYEIIKNKKNGTIKVTTKQGEEKLYQDPLSKIAADAFTRLVKMLSEFGLTPASRGKIVGEVEDKDDDLLSKIINL